MVCSTYDNLQSMQKTGDVDIPHIPVEEELKMLENKANGGVDWKDENKVPVLVKG